MAELKLRINDDVKSAMRSREKERLATLRLILAAIKQKEVDERIELDDTQVLAVLDRLARQHRESIEQFEKGGRSDLVEKERFELGIVRGYLPTALSGEEVNGLIAECIAATGAASVKDMGKVMAVLKPRVQGRADMSKVGVMVKEKLNK
ncbi:MAG: GatB/YqeY domain-containing protein [Gammaproteobacteria bacterium]|nr:GatB/YqeY domain-containing protein [Gammaproteobacteria bacterium]